MNWLEADGVPYREIKHPYHIALGETCGTITGVHDGEVRSEFLIAACGDDIYKVVNAWNRRTLDWKYFVKEIY
jgi:hypothetical protein